MTVSNPGYMKGIFNGAVALGDKAISSDATFVIEGHESLSLLIKQFPWPELTPAGEIEVPLPMGGAMWQPQQLKFNQQGSVTLMETRKGHIRKLMEDLIRQGAKFNAKVYEGTPDNYTRMERIVQCFLQLDNPDRDWENRAQILLVSGTLFFHYFGDGEDGTA